MSNEIPQPPYSYFLVKRGRWLPPSSPRQAGLLPPEAIPFSLEESRRALVGQIAIYTPSLLNNPIFVFLGWFLFEMLQNFTDYATILAFLPKHCETSRITQWCLLYPSEMLRNFTDYATKLDLTSRVLRNFTKLVLTSGVLWNFADYATMLALTPEETTQSSQADCQCPQIKLGYENSVFENGTTCIRV